MPCLVALDLPGGPVFVDALRQAWDRGDAVLPLDQRLPGPARLKTAESLGAGTVVDTGGERRLAGSTPVEEGDAVVIATSGTTGEPKGVVLTHRALRAAAEASSKRLGVDPAHHRWLACLPLSHVGGLGVVTRALLTETSLTVIPGFDAGQVSSHAGPDVLVSLVATALRRLDRPEQFRTILLGGAAPPADPPPNVVTTYGLTETCGGVVYEGVPLEGIELRVVPERSEILLRGPMLLRCYRDSGSGSTSPDVWNPLDAAGWLHTGDAGRITDDGRLQVQGRIAEVIITGGENVWPAPVEAALQTHPMVAQVAVAGLPDPEWGERVVAWVVPANAGEPPALEDLRAVVAEAVAPWAAPKQVVLVHDLPRTTMGKVRRDLLPPAAAE